MALEDHLILNYVPFNYSTTSELIEDHIVGIDSSLLVISESAESGLSGRPGDSNSTSPSLAELTAASIPAPIAYYTMNFTEENEVEPGNSTYFIIDGAGGYLPYTARNSKVSLSTPIGALSINGQAGPASVDGTHVEHRLVDDMTFLCMASIGRPADAFSTPYHIFELGSRTSTGEVGSSVRLPYRLRLTAHAADSASDISDRILEYSHYSAGDSEIVATCEISGIGIGLPIGPEFGIGYTRAVGATTDVDFYINGSHAGNQVTGLTNPGPSGNATSMAIHFGGKHALPQHYTGSAMRCCAVWDSVLTAVQIQAFYELCVGK